MKRYFVAKTPTSDFVGLLPLKDILSLLDAGKISGDYVATESAGPAYYLTYAQLVKRTDIQWESVSQLLTHETLPEPQPVASKPATEGSEESSDEIPTRQVGGVLLLIGIGLVIAAVVRLNSMESQMMRGFGGSDNMPIWMLVFGIPAAIAGVWMLLTPSKKS